MKLFSKVFLFLAAILLTAHMVEAKSPSTSEVKNALSQELPSYVKLTDFTVEASQNLGTDVEPLWGVRFNARIITSSDLYVRDKSENNVVFVFLRTKNNSKMFTKK